MSTSSNETIAVSHFQHQGIILNHSASQVVHADGTPLQSVSFDNPNFNLAVVAEVAMLNDIDGRPSHYTVSGIESLLANTSNSMMSVAVSGIENSHETALQLQQQIDQLATNGSPTTYGAQPFAGQYTDAQVEFAILLVGQQIGYHTPFGY